MANVMMFIIASLVAMQVFAFEQVASYEIDGKTVIGVLSTPNEISDTQIAEFLDEQLPFLILVTSFASQHYRYYSFGEKVGGLDEERVQIQLLTSEAILIDFALLFSDVLMDARNLFYARGLLGKSPDSCGVALAERVFDDDEKKIEAFIEKFTPELCHLKKIFNQANLEELKNRLADDKCNRFMRFMDMMTSDFDFRSVLFYRMHTINVHRTREEICLELDIP